MTVLGSKWAILTVLGPKCGKNIFLVKKRKLSLCARNQNKPMNGFWDLDRTDGQEWIHRSQFRSTGDQKTTKSMPCNCHCPPIPLTMFKIKSKSCTPKHYITRTEGNGFIILVGVFGLEDTRRPMDSRSFVRTYVRTFIRHQFPRNPRMRFFWFFMKPWLYKR